MITYRRKASEYEVRRLQGTPVEYQSILDWIASYGLERLQYKRVVEDDEYPDRAHWVDSTGATHTPGVYIDQKRGVLVIRNKNRQRLDADYGDYIMRDTVTNHFLVMKPNVFEKLYEPVIKDQETP